LVISDMHAPLQHPDTLDFLSDTYKRFKCNHVVCVGDEIDFHNLSQWPKEHDAPGPDDEFSQAMDFMLHIYKLFPKVDVCVSNHTSRVYRTAHRAGLSDRYMKDYSEWMAAPPGWHWKERYIIDNVLYFHGDGYSGEKGHINAARDSHISTVIGHLHGHAGVHYITGAIDRIFALNVGCLIDVDAYGFRYGKHSRVKPSLGCGVVVEGKEAYFVPLLG